MFSGGRCDQAVIQEAAAEATRTHTFTLDQSSHDEGRAPRRGVAGCNDALQIFEGSNPVLVLPVIGLVSSAGENLVSNRRMLE